MRIASERTGDADARATEGRSERVEDHTTAEAALRERERELACLVDMVPSHLWRLTPDGEPVFFNRRMVDFLGVDVEHIERPGMSRLASMIDASVHPEDARAFDERLRRCLATGERFSMRYRLRRADGAYRWMSSRSEPLRDDAGRIVQWYGLCHDIDDQVQAEESLRRSERQLQQIIDAVPVRVWGAQSMHGPVFFNKRYADYLRDALHDLGGRPAPSLDTLVRELLHPEDAAEVQQTLQKCFETGSAAVLRFRSLEKNATYRWAECKVAPWRDDDGTLVQLYGVSVDIDDEVRAKEAQRDRERELSLLVDMVPSYLWRLSPEGEPNFYNKRLIEFFGLETALANKPGMSRLAATIEAGVHPDDAASLREALANSLRSGERFALKYRLRRADGVYRWMSALGEPLRDEAGRIVQWYGHAHDIDDLVTAQDAVRRSEEQLRQMIDALPVRAFSMTPTGRRVHFNKRYEDYLRSAIPNFEALEEPRVSRLVQDLLHPEDAPEVQRQLRHCMATGDTFVMRYRRRDKDGAYRWAEGRMEPLRDQHGTIVQWYAINLDVDDEMRAQEALRARERELSLLVEMIPSYLWRLTPEGETTLANKSMADFLGWEVTDKSQFAAVMASIFHPDDAQAVAGVLGGCLVTGEHFAMRYRLRRADGVYRWMSGRAQPMRDADGKIVQWFGLCHDIDDQVHAEEALRRAADRLAHASRAASLAELSASIAHEVNQPLAAIVTNSQACHRWLSSDPPNIERAMITAERIARDANSAADVISRIRALFRQTPQQRSLEDVNRLIAEICRLMADEILAKGARIETNLEPDLPAIALDRIQVQQVLVNLIHNGIEAMDSVVGRARTLQIHSCRDGVSAIRVEVRDAGTGFKDRERVFEPFFTTKQQGMGMGLAICRSIIEAHGGGLSTANNETFGARVAFTLPLTAPSG